MMLCIVLILLFVLLSTCSLAGTPAWHEFDPGQIKIEFEFEKPEQGLVLKEISSREGKDFLAKPTELLWRLALVSDDGSVEEVASTDATVTSVNVTSSQGTFTWLTKNDTQVTVSVRSPEGSPLSYWSIKAKLSDGWKVSRCDFPILPTISKETSRAMAASFGWGVEYELNPGMSYEATYPSMISAMQFVAFYDKQEALYVGTHDPKANFKVYSVKTDEEGTSFTCQNWPGLAKKSGGEYKLPYEAVIGIVNGRWYGAAQVYREWALTAPWGKAGPVSKRPIPQWLKDNDLWLRVEFGYEGIADFCKSARKYFDVPTTLHWYKWHEIPYDTLYPDYFPTRPGFAEGVKELQDLGFHIMPYINGRIVDPNSKGWNEEGLSKSAARKENGDLYIEVYGF